MKLKVILAALVLFVPGHLAAVDIPAAYSSAHQASHFGIHRPTISVCKILPTIAFCRMRR